MLYGRLVRPDRLGATTLVSVDDSAARALAGVTIVRDGDFLGVVATSERLAARAASLVRAEWRAPGSAASPRRQRRRRNHPRRSSNTCAPCLMRGRRNHPS